MSDIYLLTSFISKLPDKGKRITEFRDKIQAQLAQTNEVEQACGLLSGLSLKNTKNVTEEIEWTGKYPSKEEALDSDDDSDAEERNPIKILATQGGVGTYKKSFRKEKEEESLIKPSDLEDIESFKAKDSDKQSTTEQTDSRSSTPNGLINVPEGDLYIKHLFEIMERPREKKREPFKPFRTTVSDVHSPSRVPKPKNRHWEVTAATPPDPVHGEVKVVSLQESLELQKMQAAKLKEIQAKHAAERLAAQMGVKMGTELPDPSQRHKYRAQPEQYDSSSSSENEFHSGGEEEEDDEPGKTAVFYSFTDDT
ncbi:DNA-directed RNA polymerase II subunit GRINL1A isoform X2 [Anabrus simplex]|uniref:DNA-directed RNA polymerase II subunit GRINL1A isoform X2 n=1 Tax=Anabrus simplex TaxID=316456 RepID=UPI0035A3246A